MYINYVNSTTDYYTKGIDGSAYYGPQIQFQEMDFCSHPNYGTPGCYYDPSTKMVCQNGGTVVNGDNTVNFYHVSTKYGIIVGGTAVNNANRQGVGSPYITKGGGTAVSYDSNSSTLTLDGAEIKMDASARLSASLIENNKDGLKIKVQSNSRLECPSSSSAKENVLLNTKTTITGPGKLTVSTGNVRSSISSYENLIIKDANIETSGGIYCSSSGMSLTVNNSTVKVNEGGIGGFSNLNLEGGTKITEPKNGHYNGSYIVNSSGAIAQTVILSNGSSLKGDVNLDGNVDISDVVAVINTMAGDNTFKATANVNGDSAIDISDIVAIINIMAEK